MALDREEGEEGEEGERSERSEVRQEEEDALFDFDQVNAFSDIKIRYKMFRTQMAILRLESQLLAMRAMLWGRKRERHYQACMEALENAQPIPQLRSREDNIEELEIMLEQQRIEHKLKIASEQAHLLVEEE